MSDLSLLEEQELEEAAERRAEFDQLQADEDLRTLVKTPFGRRFLCRLLVSCHHREVFRDFDKQGSTAAFLARENVAKEVLDWVLQVDPHSYTVLVAEAGGKQTQ